jgi:hypothetical protein
LDITAEINQRFGPRLKLKKDYDPRQVSVVLRWMAKRGRIARTEKGGRGAGRSVCGSERTRMRKIAIQRRSTRPVMGRQAGAPALGV